MQRPLGYLASGSPPYVLSEKKRRWEVDIRFIRGIIVTEQRLYELDAMDWRSVYTTKDVVFKLGPAIDSGDR